MKQKIVKKILYFIAIVVYRVRRSGEENIPTEGAYIICGNHVHALDAPIMVLSSKRKIRFVAKEELYKYRIIKWLGTLFEVITIKRGNADIDATKKILKSLKEGYLVGIFPEGTRNGLKKNVKIKSGAVYFALKTNTPIIPVGIKGSFKPFTKITYTYGKPIDLSEYKDKKDDKETLEKITEEVFQKILELSK